MTTSNFCDALCALFCANVCDGSLVYLFTCSLVQCFELKVNKIQNSTILCVFSLTSKLVFFYCCRLNNQYTDSIIPLQFIAHPPLLKCFSVKSIVANFLARYFVFQSPFQWNHVRTQKPWTPWEHSFPGIHFSTWIPLTPSPWNNITSVRIQENPHLPSSILPTMHVIITTLPLSIVNSIMLTYTTLTWNPLHSLTQSLTLSHILNLFVPHPPQPRCFCRPQGMPLVLLPRRPCQWMGLKEPVNSPLGTLISGMLKPNNKPKKRVSLLTRTNLFLNAIDAMPLLPPISPQHTECECWCIFVLRPKNEMCQNKRNQFFCSNTHCFSGTLFSRLPCIGHCFFGRENTETLFITGFNLAMHP